MLLVAIITGVITL